MYLKTLVILFSLLLSLSASAQRGSTKKSVSFELSKSLEDNESDEKLAQDYEKLAKEQASKAEYAKAEENLEKAKKLYQKLQNKDKVAFIDRELAKIQEAQNKVKEAISNYNAAGKLSTDKVQQVMNVSDANRLMNQSNPKAQSNFIQKKIDVLKTTDLKEDKAVAYQQMAEVNLEMDDKHGAISNLNSALDEVKDNPEEVIKINRDIAKVYVADKQYDKAIKINENLVEKAEKTKNPKIQIEQLQTLSSVYFDGKDTVKGLSSLQQAYDLAIDKGHTIEAKRSLDMLANQYKQDNNSKKALELYADFMGKFENLIKSDSSLIDAKLYQINEEKIVQLEKERALKDELIEKKDKFNYVLIAAIVLILCFMIFIAKALYSIKIRNKKIALQSLRREMNPHFIFNSLNSVNQFIAQNKELEANKYLSSYSKLMRNIMENSNKDFISLSTEVEQMKEYLDLEHLRFRDKFTYNINIDDTLDTDAILVPNMIIQPQLENAIWHGLRYKDDNGLLTLSIRLQNGYLHIVIEDNGIGLTKSKELKTEHQKSHQSRGLTNTRERISLLNNLYNSKIAIDIKEKIGKESGVIVTISFPLSNP